MKLALLLPRASGLAGRFYSGGDLYDLELARALGRRGHDVEVLRTPATFDAGRWAARLGAAGYAALLQDELGHGPYLALNRALRGRIPRLALVHVTRARLEPEARSAAVERAFLESVSAACFVSTQVRRETRRLLQVGVRSWIAHPGSDHLPPPRLAASGAAARSGAPRPPLRAVSVAHLLPNKGQLDLVEALAAVRGKLHLRLIGDPGRDRSYAARVRRAMRMAPSGAVELCGPLQPAALAHALSRADLFVCASAYESYGIAVAEAVRAGVPVVSWAEGGLWEFLVPGENAIRVRPCDRAGLAAALTQLCQEPRLLQRLQRGARRTGRRLPVWDDTATQVERMLMRVTKRAAPARAVPGRRSRSPRAA